MEKAAKILVLAGSARRESVNRKLAAAAHQMIEKKGMASTLLDAAEISLPLYHGDLEEEKGLPEDAVRIKKLLQSHAGLLICSPEYNSSVTPFLKNLIDWVSRPMEEEEPMSGFDGKIAGLLAASPGRLGGMRGLVHLRDILGNIGVLVIPEERAVSGAFDAFDAEGNLTDQRAREGVEGVIDQLISVVRKLA
jgi:NAD(P)H-dependent FMN reductase